MKNNFLDIFGKNDDRPKKGSWAPGGYSGKCLKCGDAFVGDKRALECADCAYLEPPARTERTERQTIDALGEWLCKQLELDMATNSRLNGMLTTESFAQLLVIEDIAKKIRWYRDNCLAS